MHYFCNQVKGAFKYAGYKTNRAYTPIFDKIRFPQNFAEWIPICLLIMKSLSELEQSWIPELLNLPQCKLYTKDSLQSETEHTQSDWGHK